MSEHPESTAGGREAMQQLMCEPTLGARRRAVEQGAMLHESGQPAREVFFINRGEVRLFQLSPDGSRRLLDILGPGDWFGAAALAGSANYGCQAQAANDSTISVMPADRLMPALTANPRASAEIIRDLARRFSAAKDEAKQLAFDDCRRRLLKSLLKFSHSPAAATTPEGVMLHMTHGQLAEAVGAARKTISLMLTQLRDQNLVKTGRNRVTFSPHTIHQVLNVDS